MQNQKQLDKQSKQIKIMKRFNFYAFAAAALMGSALASCSSDGDNYDVTPVNPSTGNLELKLQKATEVRCSSNDVELSQGDNWYYKVQDYQNTTKEHMPAVYARFVARTIGIRRHKLF